MYPTKDFETSAIREVNFDGVVELTIGEIEEVNGAILPALAACAANPGCIAAVKVGGALVAIAVIGAIDYFF